MRARSEAGRVPGSLEEISRKWIFSEDCAGMAIDGVVLRGEMGGTHAQVDAIIAW